MPKFQLITQYYVTQTSESPPPPLLTPPDRAGHHGTGRSRESALVNARYCAPHSQASSEHTSFPTTDSKPCPPPPALRVRVRTFCSTLMLGVEGTLPRSSSWMRGRSRVFRCCAVAAESPRPSNLSVYCGRGNRFRVRQRVCTAELAQEHAPLA